VRVPLDIDPMEIDILVEFDSGPLAGKLVSVAPKAK
jgi:hypothetical protein